MHIFLRGQRIGLQICLQPDYACGMGIYMKWLIRIAAWIPAIVMAVMIGSFSGQDGNESQGLSNRVAECIVLTAEKVNIVSPEDDCERQRMIEDLQFPIRKCAHMTEYAVFTCFVLIGFYAWGQRGAMLYVMGLAVTFLYASSDEIHQLFIPGRSGQFTDVLIDTSGGLAAILVVMAAAARIRKHNDMNT